MLLRSAGSENDLYFDPEPERSAKKLRKQIKQQKERLALNMAEEQRRQPTLADYGVINPQTCGTSIVRPAVTAANFEIKPAYIHLIQQDQFSGAPNEDPSEHIANFLSILDFFKIQGATDEAIRLRLFPLSLRDRARSWLLSQPQGSFTTWEGLVQKFIDKYFPPSKQARLRQELNGFSQQDGESLHESWERFNQLLKRCPTHAMPDWMQIRLFYDGLKMSHKAMIDAAAGGALATKTIPEARELIEKMAYNSSHTTSERGVLRKPDMDNGQVKSLIDQTREMQQQITSLTKQLGQMQVVANISKATASSTTPSSVLVCDFCQGNHRNGDCATDISEEQVNYIGGGQRNNYSNSYNQGYRNHPNFSWTSPSLQPPQQEKKPAPWELALDQLTQKTAQFMEETRSSLKNQNASIRGLEVQVSQLAKQLSERSKGAFPSDTITNPKEQCNALSARIDEAIKEDEVVSPTKEQLEDNSPIFQGVQSNEKINSEESLKVKKECNGVFSNLPPQKLVDPGIFTLPCYIEGGYEGFAMCDLGSSINVMPLHIYEKLNINEAKTTNSTITLADRSTIKPYGIIENLLVKVHDFLFAMNFTIIDMGENGEETDDEFGNLIFGRPFMASAGVVIDVPRGEIMLRVDGDACVLNVIQHLYGKPPQTVDNYPTLYTKGQSFYMVGDDYKESNEDEKWYRQPFTKADKDDPPDKESHSFYNIGRAILENNDNEYEYKYWNPNRYAQDIGESGESCSCHIDRPP